MVKNAETQFAGETFILVQLLKEDCKPIRISDWSVLFPGTKLCSEECFTSLDVSHLEPGLVPREWISLRPNCNQFHRDIGDSHG